MGSRIIESAAYCNQISESQVYSNRAQNKSVNWIIRLLLSLLCSPKGILLSGGHCTFIFVSAHHKIPQNVALNQKTLSARLKKKFWQKWRSFEVLRLFLFCNRFVVEYVLIDYFLKIICVSEFWKKDECGSNAWKKWIIF